MTDKRKKLIARWCSIYCQTCEENLDRGTGFLNCQAECEVQKDVGIACIHYQEHIVEEDEK